MEESSRLTEIAAWWGAIVATLVLLWDVFKWMRQGPKLLMRLSPYIRIVGDPSGDNQRWVRVTVSNVGDRPTTVKSFGFDFYESLIDKLRDKADTGLFVPNPNNSRPLPTVLQPGDEWNGFAAQEREDVNLKELSQRGYLLAWLSVSHKKKPLRRRLVIEDRQNDS